MTRLCIAGRGVHLRRPFRCPIRPPEPILPRTPHAPAQDPPEARVTEFAVPTRAPQPAVARARDALAAVLEWGGDLPLTWSLAAAAAFTELDSRGGGLPYPPADPGPDPGFTEDSARRLLLEARAALIDAIPLLPAADALACGYAARELTPEALRP